MVEVDELTLAGVAHRCAQESERYFKRLTHDPRFCLKLFQKAILEHNERAWGLVFKQYRPLVLKWVRNHRSFSSCEEEDEYFVNRAFDRMWTALKPEKFDSKEDLKSLLAYLHMCASSAIIDHVRTLKHLKLVPIVNEEVSNLPSDDKIPEDQVNEKIRAQEVWDRLNHLLRDDKERIVAYTSFVLALPPREIQSEHLENFRDINEIYGIKQRIIERLRRDEGFKRFFEDY